MDHAPHAPLSADRVLRSSRRGCVELISLTVDEDYWDLLDGDPEM